MSPERTKEFHTPQVLHGKGVWYGFSLVFVLEQFGSVWNYYKDGGNAGVCSLARHYPGKGLRSGDPGFLTELPASRG
ncbi:hypothetical protein [Amycolatopsis sp. cmx-11-51]|uniref:hypothetical protein n=1 Tax=unclassified Amycolatopsis TaxID=2618356 RepID=UPI0039E37739